MKPLSLSECFFEGNSICSCESICVFTCFYMFYMHVCVRVLYIICVILSCVCVYVCNGLLCGSVGVPLSIRAAITECHRLGSL